MVGVVVVFVTLVVLVVLVLVVVTLVVLVVLVLVWPLDRVMSQHPHMLVGGLLNGNVAVYNLQADPTKPVYRSCASNGKHQDIVWKVREQLAGQHNNCHV